MTRREICELIQLRIAGGTPSQDFEPTLDELNLKLDPAAASAAMKNYADGVNVDGIEFVGDAFYTTIKNLTLIEDTDTPYFKTTLPVAPLALPRGYDVASVAVMAGRNRLSANGVRVTPQQLDYYKSLPTPPNSFFYWFENTTLYVESFTEMTGMKLLVRMASSSIDKSLDSKFYVPDDYLGFVMEIVERQYLPRAPQDSSNDGKNIV